MGIITLKVNVGQLCAYGAQNRLFRHIEPKMSCLSTKRESTNLFKQSWSILVMVKFCSIFSAYLLGALERCGASYAYHECYAQYGPRSFWLQKCFKSIQWAPRPKLFCTLNPKRNDWICHILWRRLPREPSDGTWRLAGCITKCGKSNRSFFDLKCKIAPAWELVEYSWSRFATKKLLGPYWA